MRLAVLIKFRLPPLIWLKSVSSLFLCTTGFQKIAFSLCIKRGRVRDRVAHIPGTRFPGNGSREQRFPGNPGNSREVGIIEINLSISYKDTKKIYDYTVCSKTALYASDLYLNYTLKVNFTKWIQWILYFIKAIFNIILEDSIIN